MKLPAAQTGNTLIVALVMLTVMTLIAVASLNISATNIQVVGNMQFQEESVAAAQQAIENAITKSAFNDSKFNETVPGLETINISNTGYQVKFDSVNCVSYIPVDKKNDTNLPDDCYASGDLDLCFWGVWEITATASDPMTGASSTVNQGVRILTGQNAALAGCI